MVSISSVVPVEIDQEQVIRIHKPPTELICQFWAVGTCVKGDNCPYRLSWPDGIDGFAALSKQQHQHQQLKRQDFIPKDAVVQPVVWNLPPFGWIKINTDGAAPGSTGDASCGGVCRNFQGFVLAAFSNFLGVNKTALEAEIYGVMVAIDYAYSRGWRRVWIECDSDQTVKLINSAKKDVPPSLRNNWLITLQKIAAMADFKVTHIFREGNKVADLLANHGLRSKSFCLWANDHPGFHVPEFIINEAQLDAKGHTRYRVN